MLDFTIPFKVVLEVILFQLIFKTKKILKPMVVVSCVVVMVLGVVLFFDQMQAEPKKIVINPIILKDEEPDLEPPDEGEDEFLAAISLATDPFSLVDAVDQTVKRSNGVIQTQEVIEDGSTKISYNIKDGSTLFRVIQK